MEAVTARAVASAKFYGFKFFEVHLRNPENRLVGIVNMHLNHLKEKGVVKTLNSFKKLDAWLETDDGLNYAKELLAKKKQRERSYLSQ
ncbi:hypothetical protein EDM59_01655 [Brevibacillus nitrificans]|uniref:Uncharacterized protein n=1 Tax=Brevibacillus nitrificans TaxID=651560 RepID=A0A3M8DPX5_9BACL|nr:hypothetical protein [Brevibacillus nitrificans]RNB90180.1 hypothetical protein EDM59_01655 [Brevibacillus nitrificans]